MLKKISLEPSRFALHLAVLFIVALWTLPTAGLLISSLRDKNQHCRLRLVDSPCQCRPQPGGPHERHGRPG